MVAVILLIFYPTLVAGIIIFDGNCNGVYTAEYLRFEYLRLAFYWVMSLSMTFVMQSNTFVALTDTLTIVSRLSRFYQFLYCFWLSSTPRIKSKRLTKTCEQTRPPHSRSKYVNRFLLLPVDMYAYTKSCLDIRLSSILFKCWYHFHLCLEILSFTFKTFNNSSTALFFSRPLN